MPVRERDGVGDEPGIGVRQDRCRLAQAGELDVATGWQREQRRPAGEAEEVRVDAAEAVDRHEPRRLPFQRDAPGPDEDGARPRIASSGFEPDLIGAAVGRAIDDATGERDGLAHPSSVGATTRP